MNTFVSYLRNKTSQNVFRSVISVITMSFLLGSQLVIAGNSTNKWQQVHPNMTEKSGIVKTELSTGHTLYVKEDHSQPIVTIDTWVKVGSVNEISSNNGVSHFLEHLLFKGTSNHEAGYFERVIESRGARFNAATSDDFTHYYITVSSDYLAEALELHADMLLNSTIPEDELKRERLVVQEEINRSLDNPSRQLFVAMSEKLYGDHGYGLDTLGPKENIANIPRRKILDYYHYWYQPKNFNTVITGDVDPVDALIMVAENFPAPQYTKPLGYNPDNPGSPTPPPEAKIEVLTHPNISRGYYSMGLIGPGIDKPEDMVALDVAFVALGVGESSRLYQELKEKRQLVTSISAGNMTQKHSGLLYFSAQTEPENLAAVQQAIMDEVEKIKQHGVTQAELDKAIVQFENQFIYDNESTQGVASSIGYNVTIGTLDDYLDYVPMLKQVTLDDVQRVFNDYVDFDHATVTVMIPEEAKKTEASASEKDEQQSLAHRINSDLRQPFFEKITSTVSNNTQVTPVLCKSASQEKDVIRQELDNGMTVILKPRKESNTLALRLFFKGGKLVESIPGTSSLAASLLTKGTAARSASEVSKELEGKGMSITASSGEDYFSISADSLNKDTGELLVLLKDVLNHPAFTEEEVGKEKSQTLKTIKASRDNPSTVAFEALYETLYPDHPYGYVGAVVEKHMDEITRDDIAEYAESVLLPENTLAVVVGDFNPQEMKAYLSDLFDYKEPMIIADTENLPSTRALPEKVVPRTEKEGLAATWIAKAWLVPAIDNEDYAALKVLNSLVGTGMSSRLFVNLREKQGLAYSVGSFYPSRLLNSSLVMYIGTDPKNEAAVLKGFNTEVNKLVEEPVDSVELEEAKSKLIGSFALAHETNGDQAFYLGLYETLGVGYEYDKSYIDLVKKVSAEDVQRVAKKYLTAPSVTSIVAPVKTKKTEKELPSEQSESPSE